MSSDSIIFVGFELKCNAKLTFSIKKRSVGYIILTVSYEMFKIIDTCVQIQKALVHKSLATFLFLRTFSAPIFQSGIRILAIPDSSIEVFARGKAVVQDNSCN